MRYGETRRKVMTQDSERRKKLSSEQQPIQQTQELPQQGQEQANAVVQGMPGVTENSG